MNDLRALIERLVIHQAASDAVLMALMQFIAQRQDDKALFRQLLASAAVMTETQLLRRQEPPEVADPKHQAFASALAEYWKVLE